MLYARAAALKRCCKQNRSGSGGPGQGLLCLAYGYEISDHTQVELVLYARAAALKRFCKQSRSGSGGSRESGLIRVFSVLLWGYEISDHICSCGGFETFL